MFTHLPVPQSDLENQFFFNLVGPRSDRDMWLGIKYEKHEGVWRNIFGEDQTYFNWAVKEPNNQGGYEDHTELILQGKDERRHGLWNDISASYQNLVVCTFTVPASAPTTTTE